MSDFHLSDPSFYITQMRDLVARSNAGEMRDLYFPIVSFFHGAPCDIAPAPVNAAHFEIFFERAMQTYIESDPQLYLNWVEAMYCYFWKMAAIPDLAEEVWLCAWMVLAVLDKLGIDTSMPRYQMANWAKHYNNNRLKEIAISKILDYQPQGLTSKAHRALALSGLIGPDEKVHINEAIELVAHLDIVNQLSCQINYYCQVDSGEDVFDTIVALVRSEEIKVLHSGDMQILRQLIWTLFHNNRYALLLRLVAAVKDIEEVPAIGISHAFVLSNDAETLIALSQSGITKFTDCDNGASYEALLKSCNQALGVAVSILGDKDVDYGNHRDRYGTPQAQADFDALKKQVISHYRLNDQLYLENRLLTFLPSHNHPIQGALCTLGIEPPVIQVSLQNPLAPPESKSFVFFLSSETFTHDLEREWIVSEFGHCACVYTDPEESIVIQALSSDEYTHVYISAHGLYGHLDTDTPRIQFSPESIVSADQFLGARPNSDFLRTIVLNICDGGTSSISFNPNHRAMSSQLASAGQQVVSHQWPVHPLYACVFGTLMLRMLKDATPAQAALSTCTTLNQPNASIATDLKALSPIFNRIADAAENSSELIGGFHNIGALVIHG